MKKATLTLLMFLSSIFLIGQELDETYYLLGSLEDYMGRHYPKNNPSKWGYIMTLHEDRMGEIKRIEQVTGMTFERSKKKNDCSNCHEFFELNSLFKAKRLNSFYDFEKNKGMKDLMGFTFYTGELIAEKILNAHKEEQISFLAGQFLTSGDRSGENYKISLYNSPDRYEIIIKLLKELDCMIVMNEKRDAIPVGYFIEFKPTNEIKEVLENEIRKKNTLANKT